MYCVLYVLTTKINTEFSEAGISLRPPPPAVLDMRGTMNI